MERSSTEAKARALIMRYARGNSRLMMGRFKTTKQCRDDLKRCLTKRMPDD